MDEEETEEQAATWIGKLKGALRCMIALTFRSSTDCHCLLFLASTFLLDQDRQGISLVAALLPAYAEGFRLLKPTHAPLICSAANISNAQAAAAKAHISSLLLGGLSLRQASDGLRRELDGPELVLEFPGDR